MPQDAMEPSPQRAALARRYGEDALPSAGPWNETLSLLLQHRTVRGYRPDPLPPGTLETLMAAAQSASTSSNLQTWSVVAVTDPSTRLELSRIGASQRYIHECPLLLVWLADLSRANRLAAEEGATVEATQSLEMFLMAAMDATLAAQNAAVAAESLGLGICYIGGLRNDAARVAELLRLPLGAMAVFGMCVGYAKAGAEGEVKPRLPQHLVLHQETYSVGAERPAREAYDRRVGVFSQRNGTALQTWSQRILQRLSTMQALGGRQELSNVLKRLGFPLR